MAKRFRWTRKTYRQAHQLARLVSIYDDGPEILQRYRELWADHDVKHWESDPLKCPLRLRLEFHKGGLPF